MLVAIGSIVLILDFVLPQFEAMFQDAGSKLPTATWLVMTASQMLREDWWILLLAIAILAVAAQFLMRRPCFWALFGPFMLRLPLLGGLCTRFEAARFTRTRGVLLANGEPAS